MAWYVAISPCSGTSAFWYLSSCFVRNRIGDFDQEMNHLQGLILWFRLPIPLRGLDALLNSTTVR